MTAGTIVDVSLHVHRYGPSAPAQLLAVHGLTGHGRRWQTLADRYLPEFSVAAPDLIGHGRSTWAAPWTIDANTEALAALLDADGGGPVVVAGHSFGGAVALALAAARPDLVSSLVLLDPAVGLDGEWMREIADEMLASPTTPTATRRGRRRSRAPGVRWIRPKWTANSTNTWSRCRTAAADGGSACRR